MRCGAPCTTLCFLASLNRRPYIRAVVQDQVWDAIPAVLSSTAPRWLADLSLKKCVIKQKTASSAHPCYN